MENEHTHGHIHHAEENGDELTALIKYMASHNSAHARELEALAEQLQGKGENDAYACVKEAIKDFKSGSEKLQKALEVMKKD